MKKIIFFILCLAVFSGCLTGCFVKQDTPTNDEFQSEIEQKNQNLVPDNNSVSPSTDEINDYTMNNTEEKGQEVVKPTPTIEVPAENKDTTIIEVVTPTLPIVTDNEQENFDSEEIVEPTPPIIQDDVQNEENVEDNNYEQESDYSNDLGMV